MGLGRVLLDLCPHARQGGVGRRVVGLPRVAQQPGHRAEGDEPPGGGRELLAQGAPKRLGGGGLAAEGRVEVCERLARHGLGLLVAGGVDRRVHPALGSRDVAGQARHARLRAQVGLQVAHRAGGREPLQQPLQPLLSVPALDLGRHRPGRGSRAPLGQQRACLGSIRGTISQVGIVGQTAGEHQAAAPALLQRLGEPGADATRGAGDQGHVAGAEGCLPRLQGVPEGQNLARVAL